jgi:hypothetical protein
MSFGSSSKTTKTNQQSQSEPWAPAMPYLGQFLKDTDLLRSTMGPSGDQLDAYAQLKRNAVQGSPWLDQIERLATDQFGTASRTGMVDDAYGTMKTQLADVAAGKNQDILSDPRIAAMLSQVGNDAQNRVHSLFAAAGRDPVGNAAGLQAMGRGITQAQLPILMQEFARQQGRTDDAIRTLGQGGMTAAATGQQLDAESMARRNAGIETMKQFLTARDMPANTVLNLDQQLKQMPFEDFSLLASLILPVAGLGGQQAGSSVSKSKGTSFGISL